MAYWLFKSEPSAWSWDEQAAAGEAGTAWTGVRNALAQKHMRAMKVGDEGFFYHSNEGKALVGTVVVAAPIAPDETDGSGRHGAVTIRAGRALPRPVTLADVKAEPALADMALLKNSRLSVQPVTPAEWALVRRMGGL